MTNVSPRLKREWLSLLVVIAVVSVAWQAWLHEAEDAVASEMAAAAHAGDIQMVSSITCVFCARARAWLTEHQVPFEECLIERSEACAAQYSAQGAPGTPLLFVKGRPQLGFSPQRVLMALTAGDTKASKAPTGLDARSPGQDG